MKCAFLKSRLICVKLEDLVFYLFGLIGNMRQDFEIRIHLAVMARRQNIRQITQGSAITYLMSFFQFTIRFRTNIIAYHKIDALILLGFIKNISIPQITKLVSV